MKTLVASIGPCGVGIIAKVERLDDVVHGHQRAVPAQRVTDAHVQPRAALEDMAPAFAHGGEAGQPLAGRVDAGDFLVVGPDRHHRLEIGAFDGVVEGGFGIFRAGEQAAAHGKHSLRTRSGSSFSRQSRCPERAFALEAGAAL